MKRELGRPHLHRRTCESTNQLAKELASDGASHGTTITADSQSAGRGRQGRSWVAPAGSCLLISTIVRPLEDRHRLSPLAASLAVAETCELLGAERSVTIKWPNDVWIDGRKVAGILVEARPDQRPKHSWLVVGIGLNTSVEIGQLPADLQQTAATLGLPPGRDALTPLLKRLDRWMSAGSDEIVGAWRRRDALKGRRIGWSDREGIAGGVDDDGNLIVVLADGSSELLTAGEVHLQIDP